MESGFCPSINVESGACLNAYTPQHLYEGTGIGLAIVRKTVERMNGTMGLESDGTTGSKFWIQLPAVKEQR